MVLGGYGERSNPWLAGGVTADLSCVLPPGTVADKEGVYRFFANVLLAATKAMTPADRYSLSDVEALTQFARTSLLDHLELIRLVFTQPQNVTSYHHQHHQPNITTAPSPHLHRTITAAAAASASAAATIILRHRHHIHHHIL